MTVDAIRRANKRAEYCETCHRLMARYRAADVFADLQADGSRLDDRTPRGSVWVSRSAQVFHRPDPFFIDGEAWYSAEMIDGIAVNRWIARSPLPIGRYPDAA